MSIVNEFEVDYGPVSELIQARCLVVCDETILSEDFCCSKANGKRRVSWKVFSAENFELIQKEMKQENFRGANLHELLGYDNFRNKLLRQGKIQNSLKVTIALEAKPNYDPNKAVGLFRRNADEGDLDLWPLTSQCSEYEFLGIEIR